MSGYDVLLAQRRFFVTPQAQIIERILTKLIALQGKPHAELTQGDDFQLPRLIPAGSGGGTIQITKEIDDQITLLSRSLLAERRQLARSVKAEEWRTWVRTTIGPLLAKTVLSEPPSSRAPILLAELNNALDSIADIARREYCLGTRLFSNADMPQFVVGPVTFEPREVWLERKVADGDIDLITQRRLKRFWAGGRSVRRKNNREHLRESDIIDAIGPCPYVCSVNLISNFASEAGLETAVIAARLAMVCAALVFRTPSAALRGFNLLYDGPIYRETALVFVPGRVVLSGSKIARLPHGPFIRIADWQAELVRFSELFSGCGEVLNRLVGPGNQTSRATLLDALLQSLIWFEKGCRERGDQLAVMDFAASLDALGKGTKVNGILAVIEARLGVKKTDQVNAHVGTFKAVIEAIYSEGRSRTIHGTSDKIGFDWSDKRALAEQLARYALIGCLEYLSITPTALTPDDLKK